MAGEVRNRDEDLLVGLTHRFRCISAELAGDYFWQIDGNTMKAAKWLRRLEMSGLLISRFVFAKRIPRLTRPLVKWRLNETLPEFGPISYQLRNRFATAARSTRIYVASLSAAKRFGGYAGRWPRRSESTHDLGLTQVCLELLRVEPLRSNLWVSEARLARDATRGQKVPDALIVEAGSQETVIEFGGEYGKRKLLEFHWDCERMRRGYEIW